MTHQHYKLLAEAFARTRKRLEDGEYVADLPMGTEKNPLEKLIDDIEDEVCLVLNHANPSFDYQKFTDASGRRD